MRLTSSSANEIIAGLGARSGRIQGVFADRIGEAIRMAPVRVMLGDSTVTEQQTFDPAGLAALLDRTVRGLDGWAVQDVSVTNNEDLRRIFTKFEVREGNYILSGHMSVQFHVLLYYKPDHRVIECQKELSDVIDRTKGGEQEMAEIGERLISAKLGEMGHGDADYQRLFEILYNDDAARNEMYGAIRARTDLDLSNLEKRKSDLFLELDSFLMETYQTSHVMIDDTRLVAGEEGYLCTLDLEYVRGRNREGLFDARKVPERVMSALTSRLDQILSVLA